VARMQPPLFPSDCEFAQLLTIFQILGTPSEELWPGVTELRDWCADVLNLPAFHGLWHHLLLPLRTRSGANY
jgi:hypothetical protein